MDLCVLLSLPLHVAYDDIFIGVLAHRVHVEATRPEVPSPEDFPGLRMFVEDVLGGEAFDDLNNFGWGENRDALDGEMHMVQISPDLDEPDLIPLLDAETDLF